MLTPPFLLLQRFDELLQLASKGQHTSVDMLVKDIYGGSYGSLGLTGDLIASSFGKSATADKGEAWVSHFYLLRTSQTESQPWIHSAVKLVLGGCGIEHTGPFPHVS